MSIFTGVRLSERKAKAGQLHELEATSIYKAVD